jgi:UDP-glucose 4-epimerase
VKVAVTGGSGQLGTLVLRRLVADRTVKEIVSLDVVPPLAVGGKLRAELADVRDRPVLDRLFAGCDAVVHLAFLVVARAPRDVFWGVNVEGSKNVFEAAAAAKVGTVVYASSIAAYGVLPGHPTPLVEDSPRKHQPDFPYAATKYEVEAFLDGFEKAHPDMAIARVRPSILVGAAMDHPLGRAFKRRTIPATSDTPIPLVWDEDVADAILLALKQRARGAFNLCADALLGARELARATGMRAVLMPPVVGVGLARLSPALARVGLGDAMDPAWIEASNQPMVPSSEKAKRELGWKPRYATATDVMTHFKEVVPAHADRRIRVFFRLLALAAPRMPVPEEVKRITVRAHIRLTGPGGGDFGVLMEEGRMSVLFGSPRPPTSIVTLPAGVFLEVMAGKTQVVVANMTGKIRVEGEPSAALLLLGTMAESMRAQSRASGPGAVAARAMLKWFARGQAA